jgi:benzoyl-CoA reductase/2-hydroxyglutaryl-CoA dehydratase subunit BcrC/BadD/HgdB
VTRTGPLEGGGALHRLAGIAADRPAAIATARSRGDGPVVGVVGADVPRELVTALGGVAVRLHGRPEADRARGDEILGTGVDPWARALLADLLAGRWHGLQALVVGRDCEASHRLFLALRELRRTGDGGALPPVLLCDVLHLPHRSTTRYVTGRLVELATRLATSTAGRPLTSPTSPDTRLDEAIAAHDAVRVALRRLTDHHRRGTVRLRGSEALAVHAAVQALPCDDAARLLARADAECAAREPVAGRRIHLTGSSHDEPGVYAAIEAAGAVVVSEDHDWGDLQAERLVGAGGVPALAEHYQGRGPTAQRSSPAARAAHLRAVLERTRPDAVVAYLRRHDDAPAWDVPAQREVCAALGVPLVVLPQQEYGEVDLAALGQALRVLPVPA